MQKAHKHLPLHQKNFLNAPMQPIATFHCCLAQNLPNRPLNALLPSRTTPLPIPDLTHRTHEEFHFFSTKHPPPPLAQGTAYSDGSFFSATGRAGAAAICPGGHVLMARTPGLQAIYPSEVLGAFLASIAAPPGSTIRLDNQGAVKALNSYKCIVRHAHLVNVTRSSLQSKGQKVEWVKGHAGLRGNVLADEYARQASQLPLPPPASRFSPWDVIVDGLAMNPPHKCWKERSIPSHHHTGIHPISFAPLRRNPDAAQWIRWLFGLCWRPGWASYQSFWK